MIELPYTKVVKSRKESMTWKESKFQEMWGLWQKVNHPEECLGGQPEYDSATQILKNEQKNLKEAVVMAFIAPEQATVLSVGLDPSTKLPPHPQTN